MPSASRPGFATHHSSSLPSTPYQQSRRHSFDRGPPSPAQGVRDNSPRSVHSETDSKGSSRKATSLAICKYETGMAFSRRRVPYSIGGDKLERATSMPKKYLNPQEEEKLSGDMRELYDRLLPSTESEERRLRFVQKLESLLNKQWPGNSIKVHVFGSSGNMLCTSDSDVDICITTPMKELSSMCMLAKSLAEHGMERVVCVPNAKVPIVKIWDPELELACDMNVNNTLALENTRMIKTYVEIDKRVRPLAMTIKYWTKKRILNDAALGGTLSSYTWICMIINFLQTRNPPVLPVLHKRPHQRKVSSDGTSAAFADDIDSLRGFGQNNEETIGELLFHFFRRYGHEIDYEKNVVSVREGRLISKEEKKWHLMQNNRLCVEEPFNTGRNLGNTADDISFRGLHLELRRAFDLIAVAKLEECCEQYVYPAIEEKIWEKPPPQPRPVLSRSASQSGRGGRGGGNSTRGGRHPNGSHQTKQGNRRASSAAAFNKPNGMQNNWHSMPSREHLWQAQHAQHQLHDQLFHHYQLLQAQEHELRILQQQQQAQAQCQAQAIAQAQGRNLGTGTPIPQQARTENFNRRRFTDQAPLTAPLRPGTFLYPLSFSPMSASGFIQTNPSSPSMTAAQPELRRSLHRSSVADGSSGASLRSHSQPARPVPAPLPLRGLPFQLSGLGLTGMQNYQQPHPFPSYAAIDLQRPGPGGSASPRLGIQQGELSPEDNVPKEYVGYYVHGPELPRSYQNEAVLAPIPIYNDLTHRFAGFSPSFSQLRHESRSPSPSNRQRDRSASLLSAASAPNRLVREERLPAAGLAPRSNGPIIANGADGFDLPDLATPADMVSHPTSMSETTSTSEDQLYGTPATVPDTMSQDPSEAFLLDTTEQTQQIPHAPSQAMSHWPNNNSSAGNTTTNKTVTPLSDREELGRNRPVLQSPQVPDISNASTNGSSAANDNALPNRLSAGADIVSSQENIRHNSSFTGLDIDADTANLHHDTPLKPLPLLSPVREVRTPSPTTIRRDDVLEQTKLSTLNGGSAHDGMEALQPWNTRIASGGKQAWKEPLSPKTNGQPSNGPVKAGPQAQSNGWQQTTKKKHSKKAKSTAAPKMGEPLPASESERKGG
ncbi:MAG: hypothetical protein FRX48_04535 [Lasallia pustulata]|uniref:polynucleotide adenylyltransferase n=1 Tax=Lasallia pustulata TaxID=136370 RepID=A0A5M8PQM7_9LECA|nr:MAG: hypothetical protein FRX48_04535 [Lasallia pustulata]